MGSRTEDVVKHPYLGRDAHQVEHGCRGAGAEGRAEGLQAKHAKL